MLNKILLSLHFSSFCCVKNRYFNCFVVAVLVCLTFKGTETAIMVPHTMLLPIKGVVRGRWRNHFSGMVIGARLLRAMSVNTMLFLQSSMSNNSCYGCSFQSSYPSWAPNSQGKQFLRNLRTFAEQDGNRNAFSNGDRRREIPSVTGNPLINATVRRVATKACEETDPRMPSNLTQNEEYFKYHEDQAASPLGASLSSRILREDHNLTKYRSHYIRSPWWARTGPQVGQSRTSFPEPPDLNHPASNNDRSSEDQEQHLHSTRERRRLSRTTGTDDLEAEEPQLFFADVYDKPPEHPPPPLIKLNPSTASFFE